MRTNIEPFAMVPRDLIGAVSPRALQVWCCLAQWTDQAERQTRPTINRIAGELGINRRAVERALAELEKNGRLTRHSGKDAGRGNEYTLNMLKREVLGATEKTHRRDKKDAPHIKVVKEPFNQEPPKAPTSGGRGDKSLWPQFAEVYPVLERLGNARRPFEELDQAAQAEALAGAKALRTIYEAAPIDRRRYTPQAARFIREGLYRNSTDTIEAKYNVPGLLAEARADARRREANARRQREWQEHEENVKREREEHQAEQARRAKAE